MDVSEHHDQDHASRIREGLAEIDGIDRVVIDAEQREVWLILRPGSNPQSAESMANPLVAPYSLNLAVRPDLRDRQRVRFVEVVRVTTADQQVTFRVTLEWGGQDFIGTATGEKGGTVELRVVALAALEALSALVPGDMPIRLAGVKQVRAFDADMVVVSLYRPEAQPYSLVGAVVIGDDIHRAVAVAVLSALNRLLGNYLQLP
jgi:hypothetical protein